MARGWESKSVEAQIETAAENPSQMKVRLGPEQVAKLRAQENLLLSRKRVVQQIQVCQHSRHREMLERALADLDTQLAAIDRSDLAG